MKDVALELRNEQQLREEPHIEVAGDRQVMAMPGIGNLLAVVLDIEVVDGALLAIGQIGLLENRSSLRVSELRYLYLMRTADEQIVGDVVDCVLYCCLKGHG